MVFLPGLSGGMGTGEQVLNLLGRRCVHLSKEKP